MWESIKKFFKWIADHTGISWILGKLGWKPYQSRDQEQERNFDFFDELQSKVPTKSKSASSKFIDSEMKLVTLVDNYETLETEFKNKREDDTVIDNGLYLDFNDDKRFYIKDQYQSRMIEKNSSVCKSINSIEILDSREEVHGDDKQEKMKKILDMSDKRFIEINLNPTEVILDNNKISSDITNTTLVRSAANNQKDSLIIKSNKFTDRQFIQEKQKKDITHNRKEEEVIPSIKKDKDKQSCSNITLKVENTNDYSKLFQLYENKKKSDIKDTQPHPMLEEAAVTKRYYMTSPTTSTNSKG